MIKRELAKDPDLKNEDWERFLPKYKSRTLSKRKKPKVVKSKKDYTPFPPAQPESKLDRELASGEFFMKERERKLSKLKEKTENKKVAQKNQQEKRSASFIPPEEISKKKSLTNANSSTGVDIKKLKSKVKQMKKMTKS